MVQPRTQAVLAGAAAAPAGAPVLEVGCGPGHLSIRLARDHGLEVTGLDLDPAMIAPRPRQRRPPSDRRPAPAIVPGRRRGRPGVPRPVL